MARRTSVITHVGRSPRPAPSPGPAAAPRTRLRAGARAMILVVLTVINSLGAGVILLIAGLVLPGDPHSSGHVLANVLTFTGCVVGAVLLTVAVWIPATSVRSGGDTAARAAALRRMLLSLPRRLTLFQAGLWGAAAAAFLAVNVGSSWRLALQAVGSVVVGGIATVALTYRLLDVVLRSEAKLVLDSRPVERRGLPRIVTSSLGGWMFGTAAPVVGVMLVAIGALAFGTYSVDRLAVVVLVLGGVALLLGGAVTTLSAVSIAGPVLKVRRALRAVEAGDLTVRVDVSDTSELGHLQAAVNTMVAGLQERERVRDLFGRHVGEDVAEHALANDIRLGGETRDVAVLFVDLTGSTTLAATRRPAEVVELLNSFFAVVIDVVEQHGGWINKFEGDAALAVFGAPTALDDASGRALRAARTMAGRLRAEVFTPSGTELSAGIGVSAGEVVAGNIGDRRRFEYTVIGDPVNEAARLVDVAKEFPGGVAAAGPALARAGRVEREHWSLEKPRLLRGRNDPTDVHVPAGDGDPR